MSKNFFLLAGHPASMSKNFFLLAGRPASMSKNFFLLAGNAAPGFFDNFPQAHLLKKEK
jgi:hypothetical protein